MTHIRSGKGQGFNVQDLEVRWNAAMHVTERFDHLAGHHEAFAYDVLGRMTGSTFTPLAGGAGSPASRSYGYDRMGRFTSRPQDAGSYQYQAPGNPYAVSRLYDRPDGSDYYFDYDANGNMLCQRTVSQGSCNVRQFVWGAGNRLRQATGNSATTSFRYTPGGARYRSSTMVGGQTSTTVYIGALYERFTDHEGNVQHRLYIRAGERVIAEEVIAGTGVRQTRYWHRDHLGSVTAITTETYNGGEYGELTTSGFEGLYGYAAWGTPRSAITASTNKVNWAQPDPSGVYRRGYTAHEMFAEVGIIHMNGRVYLPEIGRFLSPDPFVQFPESTQNYNRYVYVGNNPMSYTDPSGYFIMAVFKAVTMAYNAVQSYKHGGIGGLVKGFLISGISAGISNAIGGHFEGIAKANFAEGITSKVALTGGQMFGKAMLHGVSQGALSAAGGGRFGDGFLGGASSSFAGPMLEKLGRGPGQAVAAAMIGGTVSKLGGGKFATGAVSAAFVNLFNHQDHPLGGEVHEEYEDVGRGQFSVTDPLADAGVARDHNGEWRPLGPQVSGRLGPFGIHRRLNMDGTWGDVDYSIGVESWAGGAHLVTDGTWTGITSKICPGVCVGSDIRINPGAMGRNAGRFFNPRITVIEGAIRMRNDFMRMFPGATGD